jgi:hypothetical protein
LTEHFPVKNTILWSWNDWFRNTTYRFTAWTLSELRSHRIAYQIKTFCTYRRHFYNNVAQIYLFFRVEKPKRRATFALMVCESRCFHVNLVKFLNFPQNVGYFMDNLGKNCWSPIFCLHDVVQICDLISKIRAYNTWRNQWLKSIVAGDTVPATK